MSGNQSPDRRQSRLRRFWDRHASDYDRRMGFIEQRYFRDTRPWLVSQATGDTLEVALGTGLNLPHYPPGVRLTGVEWSPAMLDVARSRAAGLGLDADLRVGDAQALDLPDASFDTVLCTFGLCAIPDGRAAFAEMARVVRPGGLLLLADHVASTVLPVRVLQALADAITVPLQGEHFRRRPYLWALELGFSPLRHERFNLGIVERFAARAPSQGRARAVP
ncbi:methyltransferase domain-containing protein [Dactylosporangium sp. NPDC051484]|uniref:class I SAM-dependent methyltransferase n=1 Tax=Dactylosporangium sp. NPDC051484 TaxID=3154942 RepID=UPI0034504589